MSLKPTQEAANAKGFCRRNKMLFGKPLAFLLSGLLATLPENLQAGRWLNGVVVGQDELHPNEDKHLVLTARPSLSKS